MSTDRISTLVSVGDVIRYRQPGNRVQVLGHVVGVLRERGTPWLHVVRVRDRAQVVVGLHEVVEVTGTVPVIEAGPVDASEPPVHVLSQTMPILRVLHVADEVTFTSAAGAILRGWIQETDGTDILVEREDATLEVVAVTAVLTVEPVAV